MYSSSLLTEPNIGSERAECYESLVLFDTILVGHRRLRACNGGGGGAPIRPAQFRIPSTQLARWKMLARVARRALRRAEQTARDGSRPTLLHETKSQDQLDLEAKYGKYAKHFEKEYPPHVKYRDSCP